MMKVGDPTTDSGCFTHEKFIAGRSLIEIERILGFHSGRLASGIVVVALQELPDRQISIWRLTPRWQRIGFTCRQASTSIKSKPTHGQAGPPPVLSGL
jgi:hypothetical protein